jgi:hypothetical protein
MTSGMMTVLYPVKDLAAAKQLYGTLFGIAPDMDEAYYVGFNIDGQDVGLDPNGHSKGMTGPLGYWPSTTSRRASRRSLRPARSCSSRSATSGAASRSQP